MKPMYMKEKSVEKENVFFEEARREGIKKFEKKLLICMSQDVWIRSLSQKQETRDWESLRKPGMLRE